MSVDMPKDDQQFVFLSYLINLKRRPDRILKFF